MELLEGEKGISKKQKMQKAKIVSPKYLQSFTLSTLLLSAIRRRKNGDKRLSPSKY